MSPTPFVRITVPGDEARTRNPHPRQRAADSPTPMARIARAGRALLIATLIPLSIPAVQIASAAPAGAATPTIQVTSSPVAPTVTVTPPVQAASAVTTPSPVQAASAVTTPSPVQAASAVTTTSPTTPTVKTSPTISASTPAEAPPRVKTAPSATTTPVLATPTRAGVATGPVVSVTQTGAAAAAAPAAAVTRSYAVSTAARAFLSKLKLTVGATVTGTVSGSTLTVKLGSPTTPIKLPTGVPPITFGGANLAINLTTGSATLTATSTVGSGTAATLKVSVAHLSTTALGGTDLSAVLSVANIAVLGTHVTVTGTLGYSGGSVTAALSGALSADVALSKTVTILAGSKVTVGTTGTSFSGSARVGSGTTVVKVAVAGKLTSTTAWSLTVSTTTVTPLVLGPGVTVAPSFAGTIAKSNGAVSFAITGRGQLTVTTSPAHPFHLTVQAQIRSDGSIVVGGALDLAVLGVGQSGTGIVLLSTKAVDGFDPTPFLPSGSTLVAAPVDLPARSVTLLFDYTFTGAVHQALNHLGISQASAQATATLSTSGFTATLELDLGERAGGVPLISTKSGFHAYLDTLSLTVSLSPQEVSFEAGGSAYLIIPALAAGGTESHLDVDVSGSLGYDLEKQVVTAGLHFALRAADGPWSDAFGIAGLRINALAATFAATIPLEGPIPLPTIDLAVSGVSLPQAWAAAIGMTEGAQVSAAVNIDVAKPLLDLSIEPADGMDVALRPFAIVRSVAGTRAVSDDFVNSVEVGRAHLVWAPLGGQNALGDQYNPGVSLLFDGRILGKQVHVDASVGVDPYPSFTATIALPDFSIGDVDFSHPNLFVNLVASPDPDTFRADLDISGGFSANSPVSGAHISIWGHILLHGSTSYAGAAVTLQATGGLPGWISAASFLHGSVSASGAGFTFAASGSARVTVVGQPAGQITVSYSSTTGNALFTQATEDATVLAGYFRSFYNWSATQAATAERSFSYSTNQVATAVAGAYHQSARVVMRTLLDAGFAATDAAHAVMTAISGTVADVAGALKDAGWETHQIVDMLVNDLGRSGADAYNAVVAAGISVTDALDNALAGELHSGAFRVAANPGTGLANLYLSGDPDAQQRTAWFLPFDHAQEWFVLPTSAGYAELVNRASGQCLTVADGATWNGAAVSQQSCQGGEAQQFFLGGAVVPGTPLSSTVDGHTFKLYNRGSGIGPNISGASIFPGGWIIQWAGSDWNNYWTFSSVTI